MGRWCDSSSITVLCGVGSTPVDSSVQAALSNSAGTTIAAILATKADHRRSLLSDLGRALITVIYLPRVCS